MQPSYLDESEKEPFTEITETDITESQAHTWGQTPTLSTQPIVKAAPPLEPTLEDELTQADQSEFDASIAIQAIRERAADIDNQIALKRQQLLDEINELENSRYEYSAQIRQNQNTIRRARDRKNEIQAAIRVREENERHAVELAAKREQLEASSWDFKWRTGTKDGFTAFRHQVDGAYFLAQSSGGAVLADSMGLGKTGTSLFACDLSGAKRILIVCPGEIMSGFAKESARWTERPAFLIGRKPKKFVRQIFDIRRNGGLSEFVDIINYEAWSRDKALLVELEAMQYDTIIVDEAHNIKETDTSAFQGVKQIAMSRNECATCGGLAIKGLCTTAGCTDPYNTQRSAKRVFCMTGTPILNQPGELFALLHLVNSRDFPRKQAFLNQYCHWDYEVNKYVFRPGGESALAERLSGMYLRRTRNVLPPGSIPPQTKTVHEIELDVDKYPKQAQILKTLAEHAAIEIEEGRATNMMSILALITRQRQAATWPGGIVLHEPKVDPLSDIGDYIRDENGNPKLFDIPIGLKFAESTKIDRAVELTKEFTEDEQRTVVFSQFRETLSELKRRLDAEGIRAAEFHGGTSTEQRERIKANFDRSLNQAPTWDVVLCHYRTGGVGLNLTAATATIIMDEEWNPGKNQQAYDRTNRLGQTEETSVHILRLSDSIDIWMAGLNDQKKQLIGNFDAANEEAKKELVDMFRKAAGK